MASKEQYVNIEFTKLYDMLIRSNEVISKDLIGWNQEDYDFLVNQLGLERNYSVELVKKVNFKKNFDMESNVNVNPNLRFIFLNYFLYI